jgi:hypothetical protein
LGLLERKIKIIGIKQFFHLEENEKLNSENAKNIDPTFQSLDHVPINVNKKNLSPYSTRKSQGKQNGEENSN